jgi:hypothetical protein
MRFLTPISVAFTLAGALFGQVPPKPESLTREFPGQKCRYTLPSKDWKWGDPPMPNSVFTATGKNGLSIIMRCDQTMTLLPVDQSSADSFEQGLSRSSGGQLRKRGGRFIVFQGLSCYQFEGMYADGRTVVCRLFAANQLAYHIMLVGDKEPVEQRADFGKIMTGFEFTEPPVTNSSSGAVGDSCFYFGQAIFWFTLLAVYLGLRRRRSRPQPQVRRRRRVDDRFDDDFDEVLPVESPTMPGHTGVRTRQMPSPLPKRVEPVSRAGSFDDDDTGESEGPKGVGNCRHCGHWPVAFGAEQCPICAGSNPNPGVISRFTGRGAWIGVALGAAVGTAWGYLVFGGGGAAGGIGGFMIGSLAGLIGGMACGVFAGIVARIADIR